MPELNPRSKRDLLDNGLNKKMVDATEILKEAEAIESELMSLKAKYEQYFLGIEKINPEKEHEDLKRRLLRLKGSFIRQTALKFRVNTLQQKFVTYERLWERTKNEIENGTYAKELFRLRRKAKSQKTPEQLEAEAAAAAAKAARASEAAGLKPREQPQAAKPGQPAAPQPGVTPPPPPAAARAGLPAIAPVVPGIKPVTPPVPPVAGVRPPPPPAAARAAAAPPPGAAGANNLSDQKMKAVYDAYVNAKKQCKEDVSKMSYDTVVSTLRKQVPELMKKHNAKDVEFKVVIKDGKAILRAVPK